MLIVLQSSALVGRGRKSGDDLPLGKYFQRIYLSYSLVSKAVIGRTFMCFGNWTSLTRGRPPWLLLHSGSSAVVPGVAPDPLLC